MGLPVQLNYYSNADTSIIDLQNSADGLFIGHHQVSLTNYDNTSLPAIAAGSKVENNGAFLNFTTECAISGSPSDGSVYIMLVPSGDPSLGTATVTPTFTNTAPTWSDSKQGWYGTGGSANYRYIFSMWKDSTSYYYKNPIDKRNIKVYYRFTLGIGTATGTIAHGFSDVFTNKRLRSASYIYEGNVAANGFAISTTVDYCLKHIAVENTNLAIERTGTSAAFSFAVIIELV